MASTLLAEGEAGSLEFGLFHRRRGGIFAAGIQDRNIGQFALLNSRRRQLPEVLAFSCKPAYSPGSSIVRCLVELVPLLATRRNRSNCVIALCQTSPPGVISQSAINRPFTLFGPTSGRQNISA